LKGGRSSAAVSFPLSKKENSRNQLLDMAQTVALLAFRKAYLRTAQQACSLFYGPVLVHNLYSLLRK